MRSRLIRIVELVVLASLASLSITSSTHIPGDEQDRARAYTRNIEFDYLAWSLQATQVKALAATAGLPGYMDNATRRVVVSDYLQVTDKIIQAEDALNRIYADASYPDKDAAGASIQADLLRLHALQQQLSPLAEAALQTQVTKILSELGLTSLGQAVPAVLFHTSAVPDALIVSPRDVIRQSANISIEVGLPIEQQAMLEARVEQALGVSALVVPIGGVGIYPTMITRTTDRPWLVSTIAHEWTHNYLQLRPLGWLYDHSDELRTMNETTADIVGSEISSEVMARFYSGMSAISSRGLSDAAEHDDASDPQEPEPPVFDFRAEMHETRITVDSLLASGRIDQAEDYMERRRRLFVDNGYYLRRLNQAYFAFYGAYADVPGGPAGDDPVGPAVRALRDHSGSLAEFLRRIAWLTSFEQLQQAVGP